MAIKKLKNPFSGGKNIIEKTKRRISVPFVKKPDFISNLYWNPKGTAKTVNDIWKKFSGKSAAITKEAATGATELADKIWNKTGEAGAVLQGLIGKTGEKLKTDEAKQILSECKDIAIIIAKISIKAYSKDASGIIKKRTLAGAALGLFTYGPFIGATLGAAYGIYEVASKDPSLVEDAKELLGKANTVVALVREAYNADLSMEAVKQQLPA